MKRTDDTFDIIYLDDDDIEDTTYDYDNDSEDNDYEAIHSIDDVKGCPPPRTKRPRKASGSDRSSRRNGSASGKSADSGTSKKNVIGKTVKTSARAAGTAGKAIRTTGKAAYRVFGMGLRLATFALISYILYLLFIKFWNGKNVFGDITLMVYDKNYVLIAYCTASILILLYEFISLIWSFSSAKVSEDGHVRNFDTGRGFFSFLLIYAGAVLSGLFASLIPSSPHFLSGIEGALQDYGSLSVTFFPLCAAGVICCLLRKLIFH